jgi:hypothetical protein
MNKAVETEEYFVWNLDAYTYSLNTNSMNNSFTNHYKWSMCFYYNLFSGFYDEIVLSTVTLSLSKYCINEFVWLLIGCRKGIVKLNLQGFNIQDYIPL